MKRLLCQDLGFKPDYVSMLTDKYQDITFWNLDNTIDAFFEDSVPGDVLVVYLSGHSTPKRIDVTDGIHNDDSILQEMHLSNDFLGQQTPRSSMDDDYVMIQGFDTNDNAQYCGLGESMMKSSKGVKIIGIFDTCVSEKLMGNKYKYELDRENPNWGKWTASKQRRTNNDRYVIGLSACKASQRAYTMKQGKKGEEEEYNVFTNAICTNYKRAPGITCRKLFTRIHDKCFDETDNIKFAAKKEFSKSQEIAVSCSHQLDFARITFKDVFSNERLMPNVADVESESTPKMSDKMRGLGLTDVRRDTKMRQSQLLNGVRKGLSRRVRPQDANHGRPRCFSNAAVVA